METNTANETASESLARSISQLHMEALGLENIATQRFQEAIQACDQDTLEYLPAPFLENTEAPCHNVADFLERFVPRKGASVEGCEDGLFSALPDQVNQAPKAWDRGVESGTDNTSETHCQHGRMLMLLDESADAAKSFAKAVEIDPCVRGTRRLLS
jgi:hypothetical protein